MKNTMNKYLFLFIFFFVYSLHSQTYPIVFSQLGTPLFKNEKTLESLSKLSIFKNEVKKFQDFEKISTEVKAEGFLADKSKNKDDIKHYLKRLRKLQNLYDSIQKSYKQQLYKSINDNNNTVFYTLLDTPLPFVKKDARLKKQVVGFYKKTKTKKVVYLENLSKDFDLDEKSYAYLDKMFQLHQAKQNVQARRSLDTFIPRAELTNPVRVISIKTKNGFDLYVENNSFSDVTIKVVATKIVNLSPSVSLPYVKSYPPRSRNKILNFSIINPAKRSLFRTQYRSVLGRLDARYDATYLYALPYQRGKAYMLTQGFNGKYTHKGKASYALDFKMPIGTHIHAMREGVVVGLESKNTEHGFDPKYASKANYIVIQHDDGSMAMYGHLNTNGVRVGLGEKVYKHQFIGFSGNTGYSSGPHLHVHINTLKSFKKGATSVRFRFEAKRGRIESPIERVSYRAK